MIRDLECRSGVFAPRSTGGSDALGVAILSLFPGTAFAHGGEIFYLLGGVLLMQLAIFIGSLLLWCHKPPVAMPVVAYLATTVIAWVVVLDLPFDDRYLMLKLGLIAFAPTVVSVLIRRLQRNRAMTSS